jgi:hypothetical protein
MSVLLFSCFRSEDALPFDELYATNLSAETKTCASVVSDHIRIILNEDFQSSDKNVFSLLA